MMKRLAVFILGAALAVNLVACGCGTVNNETEAEQGNEMEQVPEDILNQPAAGQEEEIQEEAPEEEEAEAEFSGDTVGMVLSQQFYSLLEKDAEMTPQEIADEIIANPLIQFAGDTADVEEGLLTGFGNAEITGFKTGVMFAPIIGSIPFVGYVFELEEGADTDAFVQNLQDNANPRWNVCTEAEETVIEKAENIVFFLMCPSQFE